MLAILSLLYVFFISSSTVSDVRAIFELPVGGFLSNNSIYSLNLAFEVFCFKLCISAAVLPTEIELLEIMLN